MTNQIQNSNRESWATRIGLILAMSGNAIGSWGIAVPLCFIVHYLYIESWALAYSFFSVTGKFFGIRDLDNIANFLVSFQGKIANEFTEVILAG